MVSGGPGDALVAAPWDGPYLPRVPNRGLKGVPNRVQKGVQNGSKMGHFRGPGTHLEVPNRGQCTGVPYGVP